MRKCWEMGGKMDLRIEKTERGIKNAFIELRSRTKSEIASLLAEKTAVSGHISHSQKKQETAPAE